ncbi:MAG: glycoside hydrolase family 19 protein [Dehalococcoidia bacterium]|nr:glycoside hydrolase family 19 protein [Dehalococcoidia bacterium]
MKISPYRRRRGLDGTVKAHQANVAPGREAFHAKLDDALGAAAAGDCDGAFSYLVRAGMELGSTSTEGYHGHLDTDGMAADLSDVTIKLEAYCAFVPVPQGGSGVKLRAIKGGKLDGLSGTDWGLILSGLGLVGLLIWKRKAVSSAISITMEASKLRLIMPNLKLVRAAEILPFLLKAMAEAEINTPLRAAAFFAQLAHESGEFRYMEEIADGSAYEGRRDLHGRGPQVAGEPVMQPGDGRRYKGRGPIQLTGRKNYRAAGKALNLDLEGNPEQASNLSVGFRTAAWFWKSHGLNAAADAGDFDRTTRVINGGYNGKADRDRYYARAKNVLGA